MKTRLQHTEAGIAPVIPREMLDACHIGEEAEVSIESERLLVRAPGWKPRRGWKETTAQAETRAADEEDEQTLAYWSRLPETPERSEVQPHTASLEVLKEEGKPYGRPEGQGGT